MFRANQSRSETSKKRTQEQEDVFLATLSNGKTYADEAIAIVRGLLVLLTAFVIYLGFNYYLETFQEMFPPWAAWAFSIAIPMAVEAGKIKLSMLGLRSILFGWWWKTWSAVAFWGTIISLSIATFIWSYTISTGGIKEVAREKSIQKNALPPIETALSAATADVDAQIKSIEESNKGAASMKTRSGKIAWSGQTIQMNNSASIQALMDQRSKIIQEKTAWYNAESGKTATKTNRWANFVEKFGGWGEWGTLLCVVAIGFFERRLREVNMKENPSPAETYTPYSHADIRSSKFPRQNAPENRTQIGIFWPGYGESPQAPTKSVTQPAEPVTQISILGCNEILERCKTRVERDLPNFANKHATKSSVSARINMALDECYAAMSHSGFQPSREAGAKFYAFMAEKVVPTLTDRGYPYPNDGALMRRLLDVLPKEYA